MSHNPHAAVGERPPTNADMTPQASIGVTPAVPGDLAPQTSIGRFKLPTAQLRAYTMLFALVLIWLYFYYSTSGKFLEARNFSNLMRQTSVTGVLAVGMLMVIVAGQIDLSVGSVVGLIGGIAAMSQGYGIFGALLIAIGIGILMAVALLGAFVMQNTTFGRYLYAIGGNPDAARLSGINLRAHILAVFCVMGALAGVASIIYTARVGSASPDAGTLLELDAIAACVIGGTSLMGGRGTVFGAILGALIMASLDNGMSLGNVAPYTQNIIKGAILVAARGLGMAWRKLGYGMRP